MTSLVEGVLQELQGHSFSKVEEMVLVVGELTYLGKDQLQFAYEIVTRGTLLDSSTLVIEDESVEVECPQCHYHGSVEYLRDEGYHLSVPVLSCPQCGGNVKVIKGKSCRVTSVKVVER